MKRIAHVTLSLGLLLGCANAVAGEGKELYSIEAKADEVAAGQKGKVAIQIKAKDGAHVSEEAPLKITLTGQNVKLEKDKLTKADVVDGKGASPRLEAPFVAGEKGQGAVEADVSFFLCTEKLCERQSKKVSVPVTVK